MNIALADALDLSVIYGLASAVSYGAGDFASQIAGRSIGVWRATFVYYLLGFVLLSAWLLVRSSAWSDLHAVPLWAWLSAITAGLSLLSAVIFFTQGLITGRIEVVAPVMASYGAVTALLSAVMGQKFSSLGALGLALIVSGACLIAVPTATTRDFRLSLWLRMGAGGCACLWDWLLDSGGVRGAWRWARSFRCGWFTPQAC